MRRAVTRAMALVAALCVAAPSATALSAARPAFDAAGCSPGLGLGLLGTGGEKDPRAAVYIVASLKPGGSVRREVQVCNGTDGPITIQLYGGDATIADGAFSVVEGRTRGDVARWTTVSPARVTLPAHSKISAAVSIAVPSTAPSGERYGAVLAELPARTRDSVSVASRVGIRVYLDVAEGGAPRSDFVVDSLQGVRRADGTPAVLAKVRNTGKLALDLRGTLRLTNGPGGLSAGPFPAQVGTTLAPGDSAPVVVPLDKAIRGGPWRAVVDMRSGLLERKAEGDVTFPDEANTAGAVVKAKALPLYEDKGFVFPLAIAIFSIVLLLVLAALLWLLLGKRRRAREDEPTVDSPA